jgi:hypothetical protein
VYSGQLQGTEPAPELVKVTVKYTCLLSAATSALFWFWALSNIVNKVGKDVGKVTISCCGLKGTHTHHTHTLHPSLVLNGGELNVLANFLSLRVALAF